MATLVSTPDQRSAPELAVKEVTLISRRPVGVTEDQEKQILAEAATLFAVPGGAVVGNRPWTSGQIRFTQITKGADPDTMIDGSGVLQIEFRQLKKGESWQKTVDEIVRELKRLAKPRARAVAATLPPVPASARHDLEAASAVKEVINFFKSSKKLADGLNGLAVRSIAYADAVTKFIGKLDHLTAITGPPLNVGNQLDRLLAVVTTELRKGAVVNGFVDTTVLERLQKVARQLACDIQRLKPASSLSEQIALQAHQDALNLDANIWPDLKRMFSADPGLGEPHVEPVLEDLLRGCEEILSAPTTSDLPPTTIVTFGSNVRRLCRLGAGNGLAWTVGEGIRRRYGDLAHPGVSYESFDLLYALALRVNLAGTPYRSNPFGMLHVEKLAAATLAQLATSNVQAGVTVSSDGGTDFRSYTDRSKKALALLQGSRFATSGVIGQHEVDQIPQLIDHAESLAAVSAAIEPYEPPTTWQVIAQGIAKVHASAIEVDPKEALPCIANASALLEENIAHLVWSEELHRAYKSDRKAITPDQCAAIEVEFRSKLREIQPPHLFDAVVRYGAKQFEYPSARYCLVSAAYRAAEKTHSGDALGGFEDLKRLESVVSPALLSRLRAGEASDTDENPGNDEEFQTFAGAILASVFEGASTQFGRALEAGDTGQAKALILAGLDLVDPTRQPTLPHSMHTMVATCAEEWCRARTTDLEGHLRQKRDALTRTALREALAAHAQLSALQEDPRFGLTPTETDRGFSVRDIVLHGIAQQVNRCEAALAEKQLAKAADEFQAASRSAESSKAELPQYAAAIDAMVKKMFDSLQRFAVAEIEWATRRTRGNQALTTLRIIGNVRVLRGLPAFDGQVATQVVNCVLRDARGSIQEARVPSASAQMALAAEGQFRSAWNALQHPELQGLAGTNADAVTSEMHRIAHERADSEFQLALERADTIDALDAAVDGRLTIVRVVAPHAPDLPDSVPLADFGARVMKVIGRDKTPEGPQDTASGYHRWLEATKADLGVSADSILRKAVVASCNRIEDEFIERNLTFTPTYLQQLVALHSAATPLLEGENLSATGVQYCSAALAALSEAEALATTLDRTKKQFPESGPRPTWIVRLITSVEAALANFDSARPKAMPKDGLDLLLIGCEVVGNSMRRVVQLSKRIELNELEKDDGESVEEAKELMNTRLKELNQELTTWWGRTVALQRTVAAVTPTEQRAAQAIKALVTTAADKVHAWNALALDGRVEAAIFG